MSQSLGRDSPGLCVPRLVNESLLISRLVNRQRPPIQAAYCYCALAVLRVSQMFPHLGTQEVNSKQQQHTQEVGTAPTRRSRSKGGRMK